MEAVDILKARKDLKLSQTQFATLLGVHPVTVSNWERGEAEPNPHQQALIQACLQAAEKRSADIGKLIASALIGAGVGMALFLLLEAAFGGSRSAYNPEETGE